MFGYASLIWRPDFDYAERHASRVHGWHRALVMCSRVNRGTPEQPGVVLNIARQTHESLRTHGVTDRRLSALLRHAPADA